VLNIDASLISPNELSTKNEHLAIWSMGSDRGTEWFYSGWKPN